MAQQSIPPITEAETTVPLCLPTESFRRMVEEILKSVDGLPGWPLGCVALEEKEAANCIGVQPHVLRDTRLRLRLPHTRVGRTVTYSADQLKSALDRMSVNH